MAASVNDFIRLNKNSSDILPPNNQLKILLKPDLIPGATKFGFEKLLSHFRVFTFKNKSNPNHLLLLPNDTRNRLYVNNNI